MNTAQLDRQLHELSSIELLKLLNDVLPNANQQGNFHHALASSLIKLCALMNFQFCVVGLRIPPKTNKVQSLFYIEQGELKNNFIYEVDEGPCETLLLTKSLVAYPNNVRKHYPSGPFLNANKIEAFIGVPIMIKGRLFGLCDFFCQSPITDNELETLKYVIQLFGDQLSLKFETYILTTHANRMASKLFNDSFSVSANEQQEIINLDAISMSVFNQIVASISSTPNSTHTDETTENNTPNSSLIDPSSLLKSILNVLPIALYWKNTHGQFLGANKKMLDDVGLSSVEEIIGLTSYDMPWKENAEHIIKNDHTVITSGQPLFNIEQKIVHSNNKTMWILANICPLEIENNQNIGVLGAYMDITRQKELEQKMHLTSITDELTGLFNRRKLMSLLHDEIERTKRSGKSFSLIMFDLDHFKMINDTYGHQIGDSVLQDISRLLLDAKRHNDSIARWGGEEFMVLVTDATVDEAQKIAERYRRLVFEHQHVIDDVSISIGVTSYNINETENSLLHRVDEALYKAKKNGRNRVEYLP